MNPILKDQLDLMHRQAIEEYPYECCGIIIGKPDTNEQDILYKCRNIQNKLHEKDPKTFERDARTAFYIDPKELMEILRDVHDKGMLIKVFYHSHPDHDAYFSEEDKRMALFDNEPSYLGATYLVISLYDRKIKNQALFAWNETKKVFEEQKTQQSFA